MTITTLDAVEEFAAAVRAALADLPQEDIDDLTDGLVADLTERLEEHDGDDLGDPVVYAEELRGAAGLSARGAIKRPVTLEGVFAQAGRDALGGLRELYGHPVIHRFGAFLISLRPVWWVARAWLAYLLLALLLRMSPTDFTAFAIIVGGGLLVASVQFGRGKWLPREWMRKAFAVVNVFLVLSLPFLLIVANSAVQAQVSTAYAEGSDDAQSSARGLYYNGNAISNIYAYDAEGDPLNDVQLFDQSGHPLQTFDTNSSKSWNDGNDFYVPNPYVIGRPGWNVYPLSTVATDDVTGNGVVKSSAVPSIPAAKHSTVPALAQGSALAVPTYPPTSTGGPTATPSPIPTATPTATPTPKHTP